MKEFLIDEIKAMGIKNEDVIKAIRKIPRENFVEEKYKKYAHGNYPLPIPKNQTISQPFTVAFMVELLELKKGEMVLEVGTGSGYNAAVMSEIIGSKGIIHSLEIYEKLVNFAQKNLENIGIKNAKIYFSDGSKGCPKGAPYDKIIVTANCPNIPDPLVDQLKEGGSMVLPVKSIMTKVTKKQGNNIIQEYGGFSFVPLKGKYGYTL